jgi:hypothetical protein
VAAHYSSALGGAIVMLQITYATTGGKILPVQVAPQVRLPKPSELV